MCNGLHEYVQRPLRIFALPIVDINTDFHNKTPQRIFYSKKNAYFCSVKVDCGSVSRHSASYAQE